MKLSGHSFNNAVFNSLMDGVAKDVQLTKTAERKEEAPIQGTDIFSSTTKETLASIQDEQLRDIAAELEFAADRARVDVTQDDLAAFATQVVKEGLRGKPLERAAQRYCNEVGRGSAPPQAAMKRANIVQGAGNQIASATYDTDSVNDSARGGYMGMSRNPNSVWDTDALTRFAQVKHGDEDIKASREAMAKYASQMKKEQWQEKQAKLEDPNMVRKGIKNAGTSEKEEVVNQKLASNSMSIFSSERDFENIPEMTMGEKIAQLASERAMKKEAQLTADKKSEMPLKGITKLDNSSVFSKLFDQNKE